MTTRYFSIARNPFGWKSLPVTFFAMPFWSRKGVMPPMKSGQPAPMMTPVSISFGLATTPSLRIMSTSTAIRSSTRCRISSSVNFLLPCGQPAKISGSTMTVPLSPGIRMAFLPLATRFLRPSFTLNRSGHALLSVSSTCREMAGPTRAVRTNGDMGKPIS